MCTFGRFLGVLCIVWTGALRSEFGGPLSRRRNSIQVDGRTQMQNHGDSYYVVSVSIGGQLVDALLDFGSIETAVFSTTCGDWCGQRTLLYDPQISKTRLNGTAKMVHFHGTAEMRTQLFYDSVSVGEWQMSNQSMWEVLETSPFLKNLDFGAILGVGRWFLDTPMMEYGQKTEAGFTSLLWGMHVDSYGVCLGAVPGSSGYITFSDDSKVRAPWAFSTVPIFQGVPWWSAKLEDVRIGTKVVACSRDENCAAIFDSGTTLLAMPTRVKNKIAKFLSHVQCYDIETAPALAFTLGGQRMSLPAELFMGEVFGELREDLQPHFSVEGSDCQPLLMSYDEVTFVGDMFVLGMPFFRKYYTMFQQEPQLVHVSVADHHCLPTDTGLDARFATPKLLMRIDASKLRGPHWLRRGAPNVSELVREHL